MTRYLLDTHIVYWWMTKSPRLSKTATSLIRKESCFVSVASLWEMQLKNSVGKLALPTGALSSQLSNEGFGILPITAAHVDRAREISGLQGDPFDLLLAATADIERMTLLTKDTRLLSLGLGYLKEV